ncbi:putative calcium-transporting ATPase 3 [Calycina marina]|uniref:P-type Na(+) transporter n=1 Tax=Calycina marina TaxID=1763456 RepID=A0A9P7ZBZ3_9HELO|nr:putative calcium-transporting ATPase 3 [Calycina marina]
MVISTTSLVDGHSHQSQTDGPEALDSADEPPIRGSKGIKSHSEKQDLRKHNGYGTSKDGIDLVEIPNRVGFDGDANSFHKYEVVDVATYLKVDPARGHSSERATALLHEHGHNKLDDAGKVSIGEILLRQVSNSLTIVLLIAMALAYGTLDYIEGAVITAVILLNIILGFVQDLRAEKQMNSLLSLAAPTARVKRDGVLATMKAEEIVVGDIVSLVTGAMVPADLRLCETINLEINEAPLTGESLPIVKHSNALKLGADATIGDRVNIAYASTTVSKGRGEGIVIGTGMNTQIGNVAELLRNGSSKESEVSDGVILQHWKKLVSGTKSILGLTGTPMQVKLSKFAIMLFGLAILLAIIVFSANKWQLENEVVLYGICVAVAVIPESLIAVMTVTIAVGVSAMAKGNVVVRKMASLEAIGGVTNICSDKTGTLTQGKMFCTKVWAPRVGTLVIEQAMNILDPSDGQLSFNGQEVDTSEDSSHQLQDFYPLIDSVALCNSATVSKKSEPKSATSSEDGALQDVPATDLWEAHGDPTEIALRVLAMRFKRDKEVILGSLPKLALAEHQFESSVKRMSMAFETGKNGEISVMVKGACETLRPLLSISANDSALLDSKMEELANAGSRIICVASKVVEKSDRELVLNRTFAENDLRLLGLVAIDDPPRTETLGAVQKCHRAGIEVHMLTGDHIATATAIAKQVGILRPGRDHTIMQAIEFDKLSDDEIDKLVALPVVLARCSPTTKVRMVEALNRRNAFCVMTGDGVNDAPALKRAHVGIAMGLNGTDVAKDAADMVLTDDNFTSIVKAVEEGRRLFDNIQKFLLHLLVSNISQVILLLIALAFKDSNGSAVFPLSPLEILWVNMITSSFLALGLGLEEAQADIMTRPPRDLKEGVFTWELIIDKMVYGTIAGTLCLVSFIIVVFGAGNGYLGTDCNEGWNDTCDVVFRARSTVFAVLSFILLVTAWEVKHFSRSLFNLDPAKFRGRGAVFKALIYNRFLLWAVVAGFVITYPVIYIPVVNRVVFKHRPISWEWGVVFGCLAIYVSGIEVWKACKRRFGIYSGKLIVYDAASVV